MFGLPDWEKASIMVGPAGPGEAITEVHVGDLNLKGKAPLADRCRGRDAAVDRGWSNRRWRTGRGSQPGQFQVETKDDTTESIWPNPQ